jgi:hypothetical protein
MELCRPTRYALRHISIRARFVFPKILEGAINMDTRRFAKKAGQNGGVGRFPTMQMYHLGAWQINHFISDFFKFSAQISVFKI